MADYLELCINDVSGETIGVSLTEPPEITAAAMAGDWVSIAGADGERWRSDHVLKNVPLNMRIYVWPNADINAVIGWIMGAQRVRIAPWPFEWEIDTAQDQPAALKLWNEWTNEGFEAPLKFTAHPYRYKYPAAGEIVLSSGGIVTNPCTAASAPIIRVQGSGDINLMIGSYTILIDDLSGTIIIDTERKIATNAAGTQSLTHLITAGGGPAVEAHIARWARLMPGENAVSWSGSVTQLGITPRWRWR